MPLASVAMFVALSSANLGAVSGGELLPPDRDVAEVVDHYVKVRQMEEGVTPAPIAGDATLIRRTTLDLVGRTPTLHELRTFLDNDSPTKRRELVDRLMSRSEFFRHQSVELNTMLMDGVNGSLQPYLEAALREGRGWNEIFRDMLNGSSEKEPEKDRDPARFVLSRVSDLDKLTNDTSVLFFGVNVSCAQCHDHPIVSDWTQDHFFGMKSFFNRTFENGGFLAEREYGAVQFKTTEGETRDAKLMFLTGTVVEEPAWEMPSDDAKKQEKKRLEEFKKKKQPAPPPGFSRRAQLVDVALRPEERDYFAKSIVNRLWYRFFGYGLVMPVDQMHPENPPSHPELMDWLARDLVAHDYDLTRLIRGFVLSSTFARSSRYDGGSRPSADLFAVSRLRALTPSQYSTSLRLATSNPDRFSAEVDEAERDKRLEQVYRSAAGFASLIEQPREGFQIGVNEALLFSNSDRIDKEFLADSRDSLIGKLKHLETADERVDLAVWSILGRAPDDEEQRLLAQFLSDRGERVEDGLRQLLWALISSSACRFNY